MNSEKSRGRCWRRRVSQIAASACASAQIWERVHTAWWYMVISGLTSPKWDKFQKGIEIPMGKPQAIVFLWLEARLSSQLGDLGGSTATLKWGSCSDFPIQLYNSSLQLEWFDVTRILTLQVLDGSRWVQFIKMWYVSSILAVNHSMFGVPNNLTRWPGGQLWLASNKCLSNGGYNGT